MEESVTIEMEYRPAFAFAACAKRWSEGAQRAPGIGGVRVGEAGRLSLLYAALALEAFIAEQIGERLRRADQERLFDRRTSVFERWKGACGQLVVRPRGERALKDLTEECDSGEYSLLVRSRNKLAHARMHVEILDDAGHRVLDRKVQSLVSDLRRAVPTLPVVTPEFPHIVESDASARWSVETMERMIALFFQVVDESVPQKWLEIGVM